MTPLQSSALNVLKAMAQPGGTSLPKDLNCISSLITEMAVFASYGVELPPSVQASGMKGKLKVFSKASMEYFAGFFIQNFSCIFD